MKTPNLLLTISDTLSDCKFIIKDISDYPTGYILQCQRVYITPPGFSNPVVKDVTSGFELVVDNCLLQLQSEGCDSECLSLADGIYIIRYEVNDNLYVEYNYMRINQLLNRYKDLLCCADIRSDDQKLVKQEMIDNLKDIRLYLDAMKVSVEYCHKPNQGMALYTLVCEKMDAFKCKYCGC